MTPSLQLPPRLRLLTGAIGLHGQIVHPLFRALAENRLRHVLRQARKCFGQFGHTFNVLAFAVGDHRPVWQPFGGAVIKGGSQLWIFKSDCRLAVGQVGLVAFRDLVGAVFLHSKVGLPLGGAMRLGGLFIIVLRRACRADGTYSDANHHQEFHIGQSLPVAVDWWGEPLDMQPGRLARFGKGVPR